MNKGIAIAGNLIVDNVKMCDVYPESGMLTNIREVSRCIGGCAGNTQGVARLVEGLDARDAIGKLAGIRCGFKATSCPDQLAKALTIALAEEEKRKQGA